MGSFWNIGCEANESYDAMKPLSKKSFEEDNIHVQRVAVKSLDLE